jgi:hypothetical protein
MPVKLYELDSAGINTTSETDFSFPVDTPYPLVKITVTKIAGDADPDIYVKKGSPASKYDFDYFSTFTGDNEILSINNPELDRYSGIVTAFSGSGRVSIKVYGYYLAELGAGDSIDDVGTDVGNDLIDIGNGTGDKLGSVTVTINQDTRAIADAIAGLDEKIGEAVSKSIDELAAKIAGAVTGVGDLNNQQLNGVGNSLQQSYRSSADIIGNDITQLGSSLDLSLRDNAHTINNSLSELGNTIYSKVGEPSILVLKDLSDNVKGISHGVIDDILTSIFEPETPK